MKNIVICIKYIKKYCYFFIPVITILILTVLYCTKLVHLPTEEDFLSTLIGIAGTLIGFVFTAMTIFFSLNKNTTYMESFKRYNHHIIFSRLITCGIVFLCIDIVLWIFNFNPYAIIIFFFIGLEETVMAAYYIYKLSLNSFK